MRVAVVVFAFAVLVGCTNKAPGTLLGTFAITGELTESTCGPDALPTPDPLTFTAEIRDNDGLKYWRSGQSGYVTGVTHTNGHTQFQIASNIPVYGPSETIDPYTGVVVSSPGCAIRQVETIDVVLTEVSDGDAGADRNDADVSADGGAIEYRLSGTDETLFSPVQGSDCARALAANGGTFLAFPCKVSYDITGAQE